METIGATNLAAYTETLLTISYFAIITLTVALFTLWGCCSIFNRFCDYYNMLLFEHEDDK